MNIWAKNRYRSSRENYSGAVIGNVCLKRENSECTIRVIDEENDKIRSLECLDCV